MPSPKRKIAKRGAPAPDDQGEVARYFATSGRYYPTSDEFCWLPFMNRDWQGDRVRDIWLSVRVLVRRRVSPRAFALLSCEFDDGDSRNFAAWPQEKLEELRGLTPED
jgi:hypothetical protein